MYKKNKKSTQKWNRLEWEVWHHLQLWSGSDLNEKFYIIYTCDLDQTWIRSLTSSTHVIWAKCESNGWCHLHLWSEPDMNQTFTVIYTNDLDMSWMSDINDITQNNSSVCHEVYRPCTSRVFKILERHPMTHNGKWAVLSPSLEQGRAQFTSIQGKPSINTEPHVQHGSSCQCKCPQCSIYPRIYFMHYALLLSYCYSLPIKRQQKPTTTKIYIRI